MRIYLTNNSQKTIFYSIDEGALDTIPAKGTKEICCDKKDSLTLSLRHDRESYCQKRWFGKEYYLLMLSKFVLTNIQDGCSIFISEQKDELLNNLFKNYFLVSLMGCFCSQTSEVAIGAETLIKKYKQNMRKDTLWDLVTDLIVLPSSGFFVLGKIVGFSLGTKPKIFYYLGMYLLLAGIFSLIHYLIFHKSNKRAFLNFQETVLLNSKVTPGTVSVKTDE